MPSIRDKLETLHRVGLGYIKIGQQATTLSGGEAQRIKLAKELSRRATGRTLYILDEPTTGLHFHDVAKLLEVLHELVDAGNTVVVIEHNLEVIKTADWIIDLGPEGGDGGGKIVADGTPEDVAKAKESYTGQFLKELLARRARRRRAPRGGRRRSNGNIRHGQVLVANDDWRISDHGLQRLEEHSILASHLADGIGGRCSRRETIPTIMPDRALWYFRPISRCGPLCCGALRRGPTDQRSLITAYRPDASRWHQRQSEPEMNHRTQSVTPHS